MALLCYIYKNQGRCSWKDTLNSWIFVLEFCSFDWPNYTQRHIIIFFNFLGALFFPLSYYALTPSHLLRPHFNSDVRYFSQLKSVGLAQFNSVWFWRKCPKFTRQTLFSTMAQSIHRPMPISKLFCKKAEATWCILRNSRSRSHKSLYFYAHCQYVYLELCSLQSMVLLSEDLICHYGSLFVLRINFKWWP